MNHENPFNQLGLKKDVVEYLHRTNQLDGFLRDHFRNLQLRLHPDKGGDKDLSAIVNNAHSEIRQNPQKIADYISAMQNGNTEYLAVIEALVEKVEKMEKIEKENEELRKKYAEALANNVKVNAEVKTAYSSRTSAAASKIKTPFSTASAADPTPPPSTAKAEDYGKYTLIKSITYLLGVAELREKGRVPFSVAGNLRARIECPDLYHTWLDSNVGIAYKADGSEIKIVHDCEHLKHIPKDFREPFIEINYADIKGIKIKTSKYNLNQSLTKREILESPWLALVEDNKDLLKDYVEKTFEKYAKRYGANDKLMGFYILKEPKVDQLRAAFVNDLGSDSDAYCSYNLNYDGRFLFFLR